MGSLISLGLASLELDWGKNDFFRNHSALFLPGDVKLATYYYAEGVTEQKRAFVRPLRSVVRRLEMLGFTLQDCQRRYDEAVSDVPSYYPAPILSYAQFANVLKNVNVGAVAIPEEGDYDLGEYASNAIMNDPEFTKTEHLLGSLRSDEGTFFENIDPYIILRLLAENPQNLDQDVVWRIADVVDGGWAEEDSLYEGIPRTESCLVVTEGSSDGAILRHSLPVVAPDIADFFDFVDMSEIIRSPAPAAYIASAKGWRGFVSRIGFWSC
ncbi:HEPN/Toprim-associated domain-containing protein [Polyangium sp. 6x1]|uniref:HEPN/Toprim-associated domain-containing protein n=1 Tax=Polyangium sp. 6x1 TaxID=3042689 RepID=UPI002482CADB|nr:HEPN/Toprim-associated domain-containing protein [Polyangium sp. 6x1]MDI1451760.1 HEPN/Toprim-associated domain-containing protein [Polyangium sp. 6x1]